jgi:DNA-binding NarL/FixJ family response regulator
MIYKKLFYWNVPRPSKRNEQLYEEMKKNFTGVLNKNISTELNDNPSIADEVIKPRPYRKPLTPPQEEVMRALAYHTPKEVSQFLGRSLSNISLNKHTALKKGYTLEEFK